MIQFLCAFDSPLSIMYADFLPTICTLLLYNLQISIIGPGINMDEAHPWSKTLCEKFFSVTLSTTNNDGRT